MGDELFDCLSGELINKVAHQKVIATDLARLQVLQSALLEGYQRVVWLDADFLIFDPVCFTLPELPYAVGREVWVQENDEGKLQVFKKVHNAFLMFHRDNTFLSFYHDTAMRLVSSNTGCMPPQFAGPKLLTALHNVAQLPVMESAAMLSPLVINDWLGGEGAALSLFQKHSPAPPKGANLCISSCQTGETESLQMEQLIDLLCDMSDSRTQ